jgi:hypothetical protein
MSRRETRAPRPAARTVRIAASGLLAAAGGYLLTGAVSAPAARAASPVRTNTSTAPAGTKTAKTAATGPTTPATSTTPTCATAGQALQCGWWNEAATYGTKTAPSTTPTSELEAGFTPGESGFSGSPVQGAAPQTSNDGILSYAAIQYTLPQGTAASSGDVKLTLTVDMSNTAADGTPPLLACTVLSSWQPGADQPGAASPAYTCNGSDGVKPTLKTTPGPVPNSTASETLSWLLTPAQELQAGTVNIALVPTVTSQQPFRVAVDDPTQKSFAIAPGGAGAGAGTFSGAVAGTPVATTLAPAGATGGAVSPSAFSPGAPAAAQTPASAAGTQGTSTPASSGQPAGALAVAKGPLSSTAERILGGVLLLLAAAGALVAGSRKARLPRLLGPLATFGGPQG